MEPTEEHVREAREYVAAEYETAGHAEIAAAWRDHSTLGEPTITIRAFARLLAENAELRAEQAIPEDVAALVRKIGPAEWGTTPAYDAAGHGAHIADSVRMTAEHFGQDGEQMMHGLYIEGTGTVICHTGTSPNSPAIARALTGAWNWLIDHAR